MKARGAIGRRGFLRLGAVAAAASVVACGPPSSRWRVLTEEEARTLAAACDQIIPPDDDPGATQAGVVNFIDRQLATRKKKDAALWRAGIAGIESASRRAYKLAFADLGADAQVAVLKAIEKDDSAFFRRLRDYTMMGFYGDPRHGGNRDRVSWRMLGVPDPPVRGRLHEVPSTPAPLRHRS